MCWSQKFYWALGVRIVVRMKKRYVDYNLNHSVIIGGGRGLNKVGERKLDYVLGDDM
jgi:hypothetical protein